MPSVKGLRKKIKLPRRTPAVTRISTKNQTTLPVAVLHRAGLAAGDKIRVEALGTGRILLTSATTARDRFAGCLTGLYGRGYLKRLRSEWR